MTDDDLRAVSADGEDRETCIACDLPIAPGDLVHADCYGCFIHAACCGPERESYVNENGDPLGPDDPLPTPWRWTPGA